MALLKMLMLAIPYVGSLLAVLYFITYNIICAYSLSVLMAMYITILFCLISSQLYVYGSASEMEASIHLGELFRTAVFFILSSFVFLDISFLTVKLIAEGT